MGAQHSVLCCSDGGSASAPLTPTVTQRLYGHDALLAAAQRIQCCVRRWLARRHARDVRRRAVALLRARRQTLHEQLASAVARLGAELQQNADLQALNILAPLGHRVASTCQGIGSRFLERIHSGL